MKNFLMALALFLCLNAVQGAESKVTIKRDSATETYTFQEDGLPILSYHFGEVSYPKDQKPHFFRKGKKIYDGSYFTDGSRFGGERSDYIQPLFGFKGEALTDDFPVDHPHHRGLWWSWCEVRWNDKIGDIWAVNKIRSWPVKITKKSSDAKGAQLEAVNVWRFDDDPTEVVRETVLMSVYNTTGAEGAKSRFIDFHITLEALVDGIAIAGRQNCNYCGYGGMAVRMIPEAAEMSLLVVHPKPDNWRGADLEMAKVIADPEKNGKSAWLSIYAKYPMTGKKEIAPDTDFTTVTMFESQRNPLAPSDFRYYSSRNIMIAFPGFNVLPIKKGTPCVFDCRFWIHQGKTDFEAEKKACDAWQKK